MKYVTGHFQRVSYFLVLTTLFVPFTIHPKVSFPVKALTLLDGCGRALEQGCAVFRLSPPGRVDDYIWL